MYEMNTIEYYLAIKNNEIMSFVETWIDLEGIMLSEISQAQKDTYQRSSHVGAKKNFISWTQRIQWQIPEAMKTGCVEGRKKRSWLLGANIQLEEISCNV